MPDSGEKEQRVELDERLLATPALALSRSRAVAADMAEHAVRALKDSLTAIDSYSPALAERIRQDEELCDHYEDILSTYLVKLSAEQMGTAESEEAAALLKSIGDFERISDHAVNTLESAEELRDKNLTFSPSAVAEFSVLSGAVSEILDLSLACFEKNDSAIAAEVEPLEQVIDQLKESMRTRHIRRLQQGGCSIELGFILSDLLTGLERTSDHCSNIAGCVIDTAQHNLNLHESLRATRLESSDFIREFDRYARKYSLPCVRGGHRLTLYFLSLRQRRFVLVTAALLLFRGYSTGFPCIYSYLNGILIIDMFPKEVVPIAITSASLPAKRRILTVCVKLFLEKGYKRTTVAEIVQKADVSNSTFQNIFRAKDGVLTELVEFMFDNQFGMAGALPTRTFRRYSSMPWRPPSSSRSRSSTRTCVRSTSKPTRRTKPRSTSSARRRRSCTPFSAPTIPK